MLNLMCIDILIKNLAWSLVQTVVISIKFIYIFFGLANPVTATTSTHTKENLIKHLFAKAIYLTESITNWNLLNINTY